MTGLNDPRRPEPAKRIEADSGPLEGIPDDLPYAEPTTPAPPLLAPLSHVLEAEAKRLQTRRAELKAESFAVSLARAYEEAFFGGDRLEAFALSERLAELARLAREQQKANNPTLRKPAIGGIPPCFRIQRPYSVMKFSQEQRFDLFAHDLQWLAARFPKLKGIGRYAQLLEADPDGDRWLTQAEYFWNLKGKEGEIWMIVRQLGLAVEQQWECMELRSKRVKDKALAIRRRTPKVERAIRDRLALALTTVRGSNKEYKLLEDAYDRRARVWVCAEMAGRKPQRTADLYALRTGGFVSIERMLAYDDMGWLNREIPESRPPRRRKPDDEEGDV